MADRALSGVKVLEYAHFVSGPSSTKLLADLGAEVIKVEEPGAGDEARMRGPFLNDAPHPERSGLFLYLNTNKLGVTLDVKTQMGREIFKELVKWADILVEDSPPGVMTRLGLDYETLKGLNAKLVMTSITPFGQTGPYRDYKAYHLNSYHSSNLGYLTPAGSADLEREPLKVGGFAGEYATGLSAAVATLSALYFQRMSGIGQHVDVSKQESLMSLQRFLATLYPNQGVSPSRATHPMGMGGLMPCQDGHVEVIFAEDDQWRGLVALMGNPKWAQDEKYKNMVSRMQHYHELRPMILEWLSHHTRKEVYEGGQPFCPIAPVMSAEEVVKSEQLRARDFFVEIDHPEAGRIEYPTAPCRFSETPWAVKRPAPLLGQHNEEVYCRRLGFSRQDLVKMRESGIV